MSPPTAVSTTTLRPARRTRAPHLKEKIMTIHRRPLARRALGLRPAAPDAGAAMPARARLAPRHLRASPGPFARLAEDRGDVPGWVLITLVTSA